jgi:hypothetical protein
MRILWLTRTHPLPAFRGDLLYSSRLIEALAQAGSTVTVVGQSLDNSDLADGQDVRSQVEHGVTWQIVRRGRINRVWSLLHRLPGDAFRTATKEFRAELTRQFHSRRWDAIVLDHVGMGWALDPLHRLMRESGRPTPLVYSSQDHEMSVKPQVAAVQQGHPIYKTALRYDARKFAHLERRMVAECALVTTITEEDLRLFKQDYPDKRVVCLPPGYDGATVAERTIGPDVPRRCIIFGSLVWIAKKQSILDFFRHADPIFGPAGIGVDVIGTIEPDFAKALAAATTCGRVIGRVENVTPHFAEARVGIMPDRVGGGFKLKNLDYIFHRLPLATMAGQSMGLPLEAGRDFIVEDDYGRLARSVVAVIDDFDRLNAMQRSAFERCAGKFDWAVRGVELRDEIAAIAAAG